MRSALLVFGLVLTVTQPVSGQSPLTEHTLKLDDSAGPVPLDPEQLQWLVGYWSGEGLGGFCEEAWLPPQGGTLLGVFRLVEEGKPEFSEIFQLAEFEGRWALRLKHFHADMKGWEEKDKFTEFRLVKAEPGAIYFHGLTYRKTSNGDLDVFLAMKQRDGQVGEVHFAFKRGSLNDTPVAGGQPE